MGEKFYLQFSDEERVLIDEPFGYDGAVFNIEQEDKRYARDIIFSSGEVSFEFTDRRNHYLERLLQFNDQYGFEAKVMLIIEKSGTEIKLDIDFKNGETDGITYFKCKLIQDSKLQAVKRLREAKINVFSDIGLNGEPIDPLVPENILLKALPIAQKSIWETKLPPAIGSTSVNWFQGSAFKARSGVNNASAVIEYGIENTLSYISSRFALIDVQGGVPNNGINFTYLEALNTLTNVRIRITDLVATSTQNYSNFFSTEVTSGSGFVSFQVRVGVDIESAETTVYNLYQRNFGYVPNSPTVAFPTELSLDIPLIPRGHRVWIYINTDANATIEGGAPGTTNPAGYTVRANMTGMKVEITTDSVSYNTVTKSLRLYDVMKYAFQSIAGLGINAPRFEENGYFYDQRLVSGNFLRNNPDLPFYITLKDIEEGLVEWNSDYEIQSDDDVFVGLYEDYYRDEEIAFFPDTQFDEFSKSYNDRYCLNLFEYQFNKYQSQKENTEENTGDSIHGESQWKFANQMVENKREVKIGWVRDAFMITSTIRKAITETNNTSTQDDDTLFLIDVNPIVSDTQFTETAYLQHEAVDGATLILRNDGSFSWTLLGITNGSFFIINTGSPNAGIFVVASVSNNILTLSNTGSYQNIEASTMFTYTVEEGNLVGQNWTNEGFSAISNIANGDKFYNLRFSLKRNIVNYHNQYLATANIYKRLLPITNTFYKNNPDATTTYGGLTVTEGSEFVPSNPILSPVMYKDMIFIAEFDKFVSLQDNIRSRRGFVRAIDNNGNVFKFYPKKTGYSVAEETIMIEEGEEKHEPVVINIITNSDGTLTINNEYTMIGLLYEIQGEKVRIMDNQNYLLYNPIFWNRVAINGVLSETLNELQSKLLLL